MLNTGDQIACAAAANLFWITGGELFTPALTCGALAGVTRAQVIAKAGKMGVTVREVAVGREALDGAEALFISNSLIGLRGVASLDGRRFPGHALAAALAEGIAD